MTMAPIEARLRRALAGRYEIERELGSGGMATVFRAHDPRHGRTVAIKVLRPELAAAVGADRFLREIGFAAQLQHPHVLTLIDSGEADGLLYYVMPFVEGESLRSRLAREGALPVSEVTRLLRDVVDGLAHAHRHGLVHRDIKPDNIMLAGRHALVVDFGVAKALGPSRDAGDTLTSIGTSLGTPAYMAPEQAAGDPEADARMDLYAVGVVAYEMLTGKPPFTGAPQQVLAAHLGVPPRPVRELRPDTPDSLAAAVMRCLEKDPRARFQSADELLGQFEASWAPGSGTGTGTAASRTDRPAWRVWAALALVAAVPLIAAAVLLSRKGARERWARETALPQIQRLATGLQFDSAFALAREARSILPGDPTLASLWDRIASPVPVSTEPPGAQVLMAPFTDTSVWEPVGTTPLDSVRMAGLTYTRLRISKTGYRSIDVMVSPQFSIREPFVLEPLDAPDSDMVRVSGGTYTARLVGLDQLPPITLRDFLIDRHEVTNAEYHAFVAAGGYRNPTYWTEAFERGSRTLSFDEAMALFTDRTGRPGPATWEAGDVPRGAENLPVGGLSWFEAAAYARYAGKQLPTVYHWSRAAEGPAAPWVIPGSRYNATSPVPGSLGSGMSPFGAFDMAGNVREWTANSDGRGNRYILGGGWNDEVYTFNDTYAQGAFDRSPSNGVRLARYHPDDSGVARAVAPALRDFRDYRAERPVSDVVFQAFLQNYDYDRRPLNAKVESVDSTSEDWVTERVSFDAGYGDDRVIAYMHTPKGHPGPLQAVVYFPGDNGFGARTAVPPAAGALATDWILKSGRAVIWPIYKSTFERSDDLDKSIPNESIEYRDHVAMWAKDVRRSIDYLESRPDIDTSALAYFGVSWGGRLGGLIPAVEPRFKTAVLFVAGFRMQRSRPEADPFNFVSRVRIPVLMLNAKYDDYFPVETSQQPFFNLLGTPPEHKRYVVYEGGHVLPRTQLIREALAWFDRYLK